MMLPAVRRLAMTGLLAASCPSVAAGQAQPETPPPALTTQTVQTREVRPTAEFVGRMDAVASFEARARVEGYVEQVAFEEGSDVA